MGRYLSYDIDTNLFWVLLIFCGFGSFVVDFGGFLWILAYVVGFVDLLVEFVHLLWVWLLLIVGCFKGFIQSGCALHIVGWHW